VREARRAGWLPRPEEELLLQAATGEAPDAPDAWRAWKRARPVDDASSAELEILPLAYRNLKRLGVEDPELGRLRGIYLFYWSRNQLLIRAGSAALRDLREAGIETMALKGAALGAVQYRHAGARPMQDFDVLVPRARVFDAIDALLGGSFEPHEDFPDPRARVPVHHSTGFAHRESRDEVDLHWYALAQSSPDDDFWHASVPAEIGGEQTRVLCEADQLLQVCAHGAVWAPRGALRWIADSLTIISSSAGESDLDWDRVVAQAERRRLTLKMFESLAYLSDRFGADVPPAPLEALRRARTSALDRAVRRAERSHANPARILLVQWDRYRRLRRFDPEAPRPASFPEQLRVRWGADSYRDFSSFAVRRMFGRSRS
jgi:hypothetical protein